MSRDDSKGSGAGTDGWIDEARPYAEPDPRLDGLHLDIDGPADQLPARVRQDSPRAARRRVVERISADERLADESETVQSGRFWAILSHFSVLFGIPIFLVPLFQRDNAFAVHHGRAAAVTFGAFVMLALSTFATCGLTAPLAMLAYVPAIVGIVRAANGEQAGALGFGDAGDRLLGSVRAKDEAARDD